MIKTTWTQVMITGTILNDSLLVHEGGLEPPSLAAPEPKSGAYANFATRAGDGD